MSELIFPHRHYPKTRDFILRSCIEIEIINKQNSFRQPCLLDTGADRLIFPLINLYQLIGFEKKGYVEKTENEDTYNCACGKDIVCYQYPIKIKIVGFEKTCEVDVLWTKAEKSFLLPARFLWDEFNIAIDEKKTTLIPK